MKKILLTFWPLFFIFGVWLLFSSPYFLRGKVPFASDYHVNFFPPWSHYERFWGPVKNNAMPDVHGQIYPWKKFTIDTLRQGQIPFWNPNNFSGNPHLANYQSAVLSPLNLLFFILPFIDAWSILILLQPLLAGGFMYLLMRAYKASTFAAVISAITFMFCGFMVVWMAYGTLAYAILYLPLALFAIEKYIQTKNLWFLPLLMLTVPLSFFSGHFQISLYFLLTVVLYIVYKGVVTKNLSSIIYHLSSIFLGLLLSLPQILPSLQFYSHSVRSELFLLGETIPFQYLITTVAPDFFGNPVTRNDWFGHYAEWASFIGVWPLLLAIYAGMKLRTSQTYFFLLLGLAALVLSIQSALSPFIVFLKIPVLSTSSFSRIIVLFSFAFSVLAGFGLDRFIKDIKEKKEFNKMGMIFIGAGIVFAIVWFLILFSNVYPKEWLIVAKRNFVLPTLLFFGGLCFILRSFFMKRKTLILLIAYYLLLATSFDSLRFAQKWMPFGDRKFVFPDVLVVEGIRNHIGYGRIFGNIGAELTSYYDFPSIEGYDPLYIGRYGEFIRSADTGEFQKGERSVVKLARNGKYTNRVLDLLGVSLIFHPVPDINQGWAYPVWEDKERNVLVYKDDKFHLYKNTKSFPRATLFYTFEVIKNDKDIIERFYRDDFDFRKVVILEEQIDSLKQGAGSAKIASYTPSKVVVETVTNERAVLFLSDNFYPGWKASVAGKQTKIYRANYTFRAVVVPAGKSQVEFYYENWNF